MWHQSLLHYLNLKKLFPIPDNDPQDKLLQKMISEGRAIEHFIDALSSDDQFWESLLLTIIKNLKELSSYFRAYGTYKSHLVKKI